MHVLVVAVTLLVGVAEAHEVCPWSEASRADAAASMTRVYLHDHDVEIRGVARRAHFERALEVCGERDAADRFRRWRRWRRLTNWAVVTGVVFPYAWLALPVSASFAGASKQQMLRQLED